MKYVQRDLAGGRLTAKDIQTILEEFAGTITEFQTNQKYYEGNNKFILERTPPDENTPNNQVPIPYGRKIISTVVGYMYKPGLVTYASENEAYLETLKQIFDKNREPIETSQLGGECSLQGVGYELHYTAPDPQQPEVALPRFTKIPAERVVPVYDYAVEPALASVLYHYLIGETQHVFAYYADVVQHFQRTNEDKDLTLVEETPHFYGRVPWVVYLNNEERVGDFEPVRPLIDAYDVLMSDSMNEFDRFSYAYLVLKGMSLTDDDAKNIKWKRAFENVDVAGGVEFLTKDIPSEYIAFMSDWIRKEIHKQSHVPDFLETVSGSAQSGIAISKLLYDFEFIAATKEAYFQDALRDRIALLSGVLQKRDGQVGLPEEVEITMHRNKPMDNMENAQVFTAYSGHISEQTLIENFAPFVKDAEEELEKLRGEQEAQAQVDLDNFEARAAVMPQQEPAIDQ